MEKIMRKTNKSGTTDLSLTSDRLEPLVTQGIPVAHLSDKPKLSLIPPLTQLAARGLVDQLEALLEDGAEVDSCSPNGSSALVIAAKYGQVQAVNILLKHGAKTHQAAITAAKEAGHMDIVEMLDVAS